MLRNTKLRLGAVASLAIGVMAFGALPASADPIAPNPFPSLVIVGSDTTQDVMAGLSTLNPAVLGSWDAFGGGNIQTRASGPTVSPFKRPNGSTDGLFALSMASAANTPVFNNLYNGVNILGEVDIARSSSRPSTTPGTGVLTFIPFAIDAMSYAYNAASSFPGDVPLGNAASDLPIPGTSPARFAFNLRNIYNCRVTTYVDRAGNDQTIQPLIPQTGSGTRSYWITTMAIPTGAGTTFPACVSDLGNTVQEHDGRFLTGLHQIVGYSIAQYIAQGRHTQITQTSVQERKGNAVLGRVGTANPFTLSGSTLTLNASFPIQRQVFNVVETTRLGEPAIAAALVGPTSTFCTAAGTAIIQSYGFAPDPTNCGTTTLTGSYRTSPPS